MKSRISSIQEGCTGRWANVAARIVAVSAVIAFPFLLWALDRWALDVEGNAYLASGSVLRNAMPGLVVIFLLWAITRRLLFPALLVGSIHVLLYVAASIKLDVLGTPVNLQDRYFLTSFDAGSAQLFGAYIEGYPVWQIGLGSVFMLVAAWVVEKPWFSRARLVRWGWQVFVALLSACLWHAAWPWNAAYTQEKVRASKQVDILGVLRSGLISSLVYRHVEILNMPRILDMPAFKSLVADLGGAKALSSASAPEVAPDIVIVMSESLVDPRMLKGMASMPEIIPNLRHQIELGHGGGMKVPTYGGGTVRTEFEVLTAMPLAAFPATEYPYADLQRKQMPGLAALLARNGYATSAVHGNAGSFWNRTTTYRGMGFQRFITEREFQKWPGAFRDGRWYSDQTMTDIVLRELEQEPAKPKFVFAISMQAHGPYHDKAEVEDPTAWAAIQLPSSLQGDAELPLRNHLYHVSKADEQFGRLLQEMRKRGRPFVLAFFGDHLPGLPEAWSAMGFTNGGGTDLQLLPWTVVAEGIERPSGPSAAVPQHSWQLPAYILSSAGIEPRTSVSLDGLGINWKEQVPCGSDRYSAASGLPRY
ncbi:alkaline phosphatase family protein [Stenotrophomonas sp. Marseille-Q4652]|uniref:LTA synthase family protein n=1 Tax=Stenotrophomonas sp. Marseille-Q4652 TaxID=2866595 RepID=UPI001CE4A542|nr:alkaline phosphatase family protein [Stenotrophomonas sp. Marseille-Q4652]